jgi:exopolysaccharide biosynthesis polyprenyl glycosylphosphotransferase
MQKISQRIVMLSIKALDQAILVSCLLTAAAIESRQLEGLSFTGFLSIRLKLSNFLIFLLVAATWQTLLTIFDLYHSRRFESWKTDIIDVVHATTVCTLVLFVLSLIFNIAIAQPLFFFLFWFNLTLLTILLRILLRFLLEFFRRRGLHVTNVLIVGSNSRAVDFARSIENKLELGYRVIGFVDNNWHGMKDFQASGYPLVAHFKDFPRYLRGHVVDEVIIDLPLNSFYRQVSEIVTHCLEQGIMVRFISDSFYLLRNLKLARSTFEQFNDSTVISVHNGLLGGLPLAAKRLFDFIGALVLLSALSPLFFLVAFLIKLTSSGSIFFVQERLGLNKRLFKMYKFRSMTMDAEKLQPDLEKLNEASGPVFKIKNDPRVTPIGAILRKTSLDELPQLINVLAGDMSLVGPRPLPVRDYQGFNEDWQRRRFSVRPGLTCLWQIQGRSSLSFDEWMKLDMQYIDQWSFWLDIKILLLTIPAVFKEKGAF